ncbi:MAG: flavin reductase [Litoreibacter sp.]|nr:flavin reductase [Litoreibacter sp.]
MNDIDPGALRNAFGSFMTGVTVVTTFDTDHAPLGFTANSFSSVSLDPPLLSVCIAKASQNLDTFTQAAGFAVNVLTEEQIDLSNTFARPVENRFNCVDYARGPAGSPILDGVAAWFDCSLFKAVDAGDHIILIGEVKGFEDANKAGLGYARGTYITPNASAQALSEATEVVVSALIEREGQVLLWDDAIGGLALPEKVVTTQGASAALVELLAETGLEAKPGFVYSVFEDTYRRRQHLAFLCEASDGTPSRGAFVSMDAQALDDVTDPAIVTMLARRARERAQGSIGIYVGNERRGETRLTA